MLLFEDGVTTLQSNSVAVVYLAWLPYGIGHFKTFVSSYLKYKSGAKHELIIVFNGLSVNRLEKPAQYIELLESFAISPQKYLYFQEGQDIEIYKQTAAKLATDLILFFNSYSEILATNWLQFYVSNFTPGVGIIGAGGSFQSYYSSVFQKHPYQWENAKGFVYNFRKYKLFVKAFFYWRFLFKPFPNPTIRTNAFMVRRNDFLKVSHKKIDSKFKAYQFESGRKGLTHFFLSQHLKALVIDRKGVVFDQPNWKLSSTFWINNQENLLVADNQTRIYAAATAAEKKEMTWLAWGKNE